MRPKIISHMVSSIDGRLLVDRWTPPAKGIDRALLMGYYDQIAARFHAVGWIVGRKSMEPFTSGTARSVTPHSSADLRRTFVADRQGRNIAVAIDPQGKLHYGQDNAGGDHVVAVIGAHVPDAYLAELRGDGVSYVFAGSDGHDLSAAMEVLGDTFGIHTLLLEGGGITNGYFLKAGLIDEISTLIYPGIDGLAGVPSIFEYVGQNGERPAKGCALRLLTSEILEGGMVWLHHRVEQAS